MRQEWKSVCGVDSLWVVFKITVIEIWKCDDSREVMSFLRSRILT